MVGGERKRFPFFLLCSLPSPFLADSASSALQDGPTWSISASPLMPERATNCPPKAAWRTSPSICRSREPDVALPDKSSQQWRAWAAT